MRRMFFKIFGVVTTAALAALPLAHAPAGAQEASPNILIFMTDDQRAYDTFQVMPATRKYFSSGLKFPNAVATTPLCCPSRASIFTGRYAHNHDVRSNDRRASRALDQTTTSQYYLQQAGYRTGIFGKYLNGWDVVNPPPYFDEYAITKRGYYGARFGIGLDGVHEVRELPGYSTNFIARKSLQFLQRSEVEDDRPWLLYVTPYAPHHPSTPPGRYVGERVPFFTPDPAMLEDDLSDKPPHYTQYVRPYDELGIAKRRAKQLRSLMAVDDLVADVTAALEAQGETNTLVFFMSDNGYLWGEHGLRRKGLPYEPSVRIPLMMRWDGNVLTGTDERLAANIDIAPTVLDAAQVPPSHTVDGKSLLDFWERDEVLTEVFAYENRPDLWWASLISKDYQYIEYYGADETLPAFREYYDLAADPYQLSNVFADGDPLNDPDVTALSSRLAGYRSCPLLTSCP